MYIYELRYDFKQYNSKISNYMKELLNNSKTAFQEQIRNGQIGRNGEHDINSLAGCIQNIEEYLYYNYKKQPEAFELILNSTVNNVKTVRSFTR